MLPQRVGALRRATQRSPSCATGRSPSSRERRQNQARVGVLHLKAHAGRQAVLVSEMAGYDDLTFGRDYCRRHQVILPRQVRQDRTERAGSRCTAENAVEIQAVVG